MQQREESQHQGGGYREVPIQIRESGANQTANFGIADILEYLFIW